MKKMRRLFAVATALAVCVAMISSTAALAEPPGKDDEPTVTMVTSAPEASPNALIRCTNGPVTGYNESLLCIQVDNYAYSHDVTVWYDYRGRSREQIRLAYSGIHGDVHFDDGAFWIEPGTIRGYRWHWGHRSPPGCYHPGMQWFSRPIPWFWGKPLCI